MASDLAKSHASNALLQLNATLKRPISPSFEDIQGDISRKRIKERNTDDDDGRLEGYLEQEIEPIRQMVVSPSMSAANKLAEDLAQELQCGCCSELVYRPVVVSPCQHFFCGRYVRHSTILFMIRYYWTILADASLSTYHLAAACFGLK